MAVRAYIDSSGNPKQLGARFVAVAAYAAPKEMWAPAEEQWCKMLEYHGANYLHMKELKKPDGPFGNWSDERISDLLMNAMTILLARGPAFWPIVYVKELSSGAGGHRSVALECMRYCVGTVLGGLHANAESDLGKVDIYADENERFLGAFRDLWCNGNVKKREEWPHRIRSMTEAQMTKTPGIQMADMLAWTARRTLERRDTGPLFSMMTLFGTRVFSNVKWMKRKKREVMSDLKRRIRCLQATGKKGYPQPAESIKARVEEHRERAKRNPNRSGRKPKVEPSVSDPSGQPDRA